MSMPRRVGVLTFHRCVNYGSYWQSRRLLEGLRARGLDAVLLDHDSPSARAAEWSCALRPVLPASVPPLDRLRYGLKALRFSREVARLPRSRRFSLDDPADMEDFDLVIVGSDEVWNLRHPWYGGRKLFFGDGLRARRWVSYAASFGAYGAAEGLESRWAERLKTFSAVSVRDQSSRRLLRSSVGVDPELVLDPCLLFPPEAEPDGEEPYVAVYGHNFSPGLAQAARRWAGERGLPLVSFGYRNPWADVQRLAPGPRDFPRFMASAAAVVTNFFHGCVFSLAYGRPFACEGSPYRATKIADLLALLGEERRRVEPGARLDGVLDEAPDDDLRARVEVLRRASDDFLERALE